MKRVCIQWPRFGPYHLARLQATHAFLQQQGATLTALETAGTDATYAWRPEQGAQAFPRVQLFPNHTFDDLSPGAIHRRAVDALDRLAPDAVAINSYSLPDARACLWWCRRHRRVAILMMESKADDAPRAAWRERIKALLVGQFDAALAGGTPQQDYLTRLHFPAPLIFQGYDVVDNAYYRAAADAARRQPEAYRHLPGLQSDSRFFLASGRFIPRKNLCGLLQAYRLYRTQAERPWRLVVLGDGPERPPLEALIRTAPIDGVILAGFQQVDTIPAYYGLASAFVHPASNDQWGLVVNEAMAAGLPVLVSTGTGCAQDLVVEGENGYRFDPADTVQLAQLMHRLTASAADLHRMGARSQEIIAAWTPERFAQNLWQAVQAGRARARRAFDPAARALLFALRRAARSVDAFHSVDV